MPTNCVVLGERARYGLGPDAATTVPECSGDARQRLTPHGRPGNAENCHASRWRGVADAGRPEEEPHYVRTDLPHTVTLPFGKSIKFSAMRDCAAQRFIGSRSSPARLSGERREAQAQPERFQ